MHATPVCDLVVLSLTADVHSLILFTSTIDPVAIRFLKWWNSHSNLNVFNKFTSLDMFGDAQQHWKLNDMKRYASATCASMSFCLCLCVYLRLCVSVCLCNLDANRQILQLVW